MAKTRVFLLVYRSVYLSFDCYDHKDYVSYPMIYTRNSLLLSLECQRARSKKNVQESGIGQGQKRISNGKVKKKNLVKTKVKEECRWARSRKEYLWLLSLHSSLQELEILGP